MRTNHDKSCEVSLPMVAKEALTLELKDLIHEDEEIQTLAKQKLKAAVVSALEDSPVK